MAQQVRALTDCSSRGSRFKFQQPHGSSQLSVTSFPGDLMSSFNFQKHQAHMWYTDTHGGKTPRHIKGNKILKRDINYETG